MRKHGRMDGAVLKKGISNLSLSDIRVSVFPLWFFLMHEIPFSSDLLLVFFSHPYIFQVRKEPLEPLDPKVCWSIRYLLWIFSLGSFRYEYCPWVLTLSFFGFFFCALVRKQTLFSLMVIFYNETILQNPSLFCTTGDQGEKGSRGMTGQWIVFLE